MKKRSLDAAKELNADREMARLLAIYRRILEMTDPTSSN